MDVGRRRQENSRTERQKMSRQKVSRQGEELRWALTLEGGKVKTWQKKIWNH